MSTEDLITSKLAGRFVVFDGPDGCGKTTQLTRLEQRLTDFGQHVVRAHDPGGTEIGDRIRSVLLDYDLSRMDVRCETFLFMASRAQLVSEVIEPALAEGATVLCSRFISATYAYQGAAGYDVSGLLELGNLAVGDFWPDLTIILDVPIEDGFKRTGRGRPARQGQSRNAGNAEQGMLIEDARPHDAMEARSLEFHRKVRKRFLSLRAEYPKPVVVVDGTGTPEEVHARVSEAVERVRF